MVKPQALLGSIPNLITLARLVMVPSIVWFLIDGSYAAGFWLFLLTGASDAVDGFLARQFKVVSVLGAVLDPLADKALLVSIYVTLGVLLKIPTWLVIMVVSRDLLIVAGVMLSWFMGSPIEMRPLKVSKVNTFAQIIYAALVLADLGLVFALGWIPEAFAYVVAALTISSTFAYLVEWMRHMSRH